MKPCPDCGRHIVSTDCPFCHPVSMGTKVIKIAAAIATPFVLAACYGGPSVEGDSADTGTGAGQTGG